MQSDVVPSCASALLGCWPYTRTADSCFDRNKLSDSYTAHREVVQRKLAPAEQEMPQHLCCQVRLTPHRFVVCYADYSACRVLRLCAL